MPSSLRGSSVTEPGRTERRGHIHDDHFVAATEHVRQTLKSWRGAARMTPIKCLYQRWNAIGDTASLKDWTLYVNDISADASNVTVTAGKDQSTDAGQLHHLHNERLSRADHRMTQSDFIGLVNGKTSANRALQF